MVAPPTTTGVPPKPISSRISLAYIRAGDIACGGLAHEVGRRTNMAFAHPPSDPTWSLEASMPMLRAHARTTVGPAPVNRPPMPSSLTMRVRASKTPL